MKKNGWKVIPLLLALALAASFFGCSKKEKEDNMPTVGTKASVEQYTFDGISAPSTTAEPAEATTKSSSGGSYIGSGNSYLGGYQAANRLPTAASPNAGYGSSSTTKPAGTTKKPSSADISQILVDLQALFPWITSARLTTICLGRELTQTRWESISANSSPA